MEDKNALILAELLENGKKTVIVRGDDNIQKMGLLIEIVLCLLESGLNKDWINCAVKHAFISSDFNKKFGIHVAAEPDMRIENLFSQLTPEDFIRANSEGL